MNGLTDTAPASGSPDKGSPRPVLRARPGNQGIALFKTMALGSIPPSLPKAAEVIRRESDTSEGRRVDDLLDNLWPQVEQEGLNECLSLSDDGDVLSDNHLVPPEPVPRRQLPQRREPLSESPCDAKGAQPWVNEAESLHKIVGPSQFSNADRSAVLVSAPSPNASKERLEPRRLANAGDNSKEIQEVPCSTTPRESSMLHESMLRRDNTLQQESGSVDSNPQQISSSAGPFQPRDAVLTLHYNEGEQPLSEILRLEGGQGSPVIVEAVAVDSKASRAGVKPGYSLVTLNGRREFLQLPGWQVRLLLEAPITLIFDPAPQPTRTNTGFCTEIRLKRLPDVIGVAPKVGVCGPKDKGMLVEEVVFKQGSAPLFIKSGNDFPESIVEGSQSYIYELRQRDAQVLVGRAVHGARTAVDSALEAECVSSPAVQGWRGPSSISSCSLELVAECANSREDSLNSWEGHPTSRHFVFHKTASPKPASHPARRRESLLKNGPIAPKTSPDNELDVDDLDSKPSLHLDLPAPPKVSPTTINTGIATKGLRESRQTAKKSEIEETPSGNAPAFRYNDRARSPGEAQASSGCGCWHEDGDNWLNFHSSRSPLRWLAPVLEPVIRAFSPSRSPSSTKPARPANSPRSSPRTSPRSSPRSSPRGAGTHRIISSFSREQSQTFESRAIMAPRVSDSPMPGQSFPRRGRDQTITPITGASIQLSPRPGLQLPTGLPKFNEVGDSARNLHRLPGPRSHSPQIQVPAGDTQVVVLDDHPRTPRPHTPGEKERGVTRRRKEQPGFRASWNEGMKTI